MKVEIEPSDIKSEKKIGTTTTLDHVGTLDDVAYRVRDEGVVRYYHIE